MSRHETQCQINNGNEKYTTHNKSITESYAGDENDQKIRNAAEVVHVKANIMNIWTKLFS